jgi:hypothetical protein
MPPRRPRRTVNRYDLAGARDLGARGRPPGGLVRLSRPFASCR